jgi:ABC-type phosphate/phosphonate transport system substrate-binding protein
MRTLDLLLHKAVPAAVCAAALSACTSPERAPQPPPAPVRTLKIAVNDIYCRDTACSCVYEVATRYYDPALLDRIERESGFRLQLDYFSETYQLEDAIASGKYDGALCKPWYAFRHEKEAGTRFERIADLLDPDGNRWLTGLFIVPTNSPIHSLREISGRRLFIGEPDSYEKHYAALLLLREQQTRPAQTVQRASCSENIGALQDGDADAAVISDYSLFADCAVDFASPEEFRILARTEKIPLASFMINCSRVTPEEARRLQSALLKCSGKDAPACLAGGGFAAPAPWNPPEREAP